MKRILYVDGYNIIGAWPAADREGWPLDLCRDKLIHLLEDYAGYTDQEVYVVFDGYKADRPTHSIDPRDGLTVVYTRHGETADRYIERQCQLLPPYREARVATSDALEQTIILGRGATRLSARELWQELLNERHQRREKHMPAREAHETTFSASLTPAQREILEKIRREGRT